MKFTTLQQRNIHKYVHNWLPTGEVQDRRYHTTTMFSQCTQADTRDHMRQCQHNQPQMTTYFTTLEQQLKKWRREPGLARLWIATLKGQSVEYTGTETNQASICKLCSEQAALGYAHRWTGFLTQTWGDIQEAYHRQEKHDQAYTEKCWTTHLVHSIWDFAFSLWKQRVHRVHEKINPYPHIDTQYYSK